MYFTKYPIFITQGDIAGIGWQFLLRILQKPEHYLTYQQIEIIPNIVVIGSMIQQESSLIHTLFSVVQKVDIQNQNDTKTLPNKPIFIQIATSKASLGQPSINVAKISYQCIQEAVQLWKQYPNSSLITLPVSKEWILKAGISFAGHTEVLQEIWNIPTFMCMYHKKLSVILLTNHVPLSQVATKIKTVDFIELKKALLFFKKLFQDEKPIAFLGFNPHAGEGGEIGTEELWLQEKLNFLQEAIPIDGFLPADSAFLPSVRSKYSAMLANYHDQGLIPFKTLYSSDGVNITLNLPQLRVSPDHGPAYDLATEDKINTADMGSILNSLIFAINWSQKWTKLYLSL